MNKTPQKITDCVETSRRGRQNYMNEIKESILNDAKKIILVNATDAINVATNPDTNASTSCCPVHSSLCTFCIKHFSGCK